MVGRELPRLGRVYPIYIICLCILVSPYVTPSTDMPFDSNHPRSKKYINK